MGIDCFGSDTHSHILRIVLGKLLGNLLRRPLFSKLSMDVALQLEVVIQNPLSSFAFGSVPLCSPLRFAGSVRILIAATQTHLSANRTGTSGK